ncbi:MAG: BMC domain-containing protein [Myxococcota bacterium]
MDALALLELDSIARGYRTLDAMVKESPVTVVEANLVEPGRFLILFGGGVAEVETAYARGLEVAGEDVRDKVLLWGVHPRVWECIAGKERCGEPDAIGIVEASSVAGTIAAGDASVKSADVELCALRFTPGLGGKGYYVVNGLQHDVEAAVAAGTESLTARGRLVRAEVVPRAHREFLAHVLRRAPFGAV